MLTAEFVVPKHKSAGIGVLLRLRSTEPLVFLMSAVCKGRMGTEALHSVVLLG